MSSPAIGVILGQIGTPEDLSTPAIRRYLKVFLSDERVMDLPRWYWLPILHGAVLTRRPQRIKHHYQEIWTENGSPLLLYSEAQRAGVQERLGTRFRVELGLAYSEPSIGLAIRRLREAGIHRIVVVPLFPQFSTSTTAAIYDETMFQALGRGRRKGKPQKHYIPALRFVEPYYNDPSYIRVLSQDIETKLAALPQPPDTLLFSYHGLPMRYVEEGDPYQDHTRETTQLLAAALALPTARYQVTYQSRFGREAWLGPYTQTVLTELPRRGVERVAIVSPGFTTDCLETLHELGIEGAELFAEGGGDPANVHQIHCLNDSPPWLDYLADLVRTHAQGWN